MNLPTPLRVLGLAGLFALPTACFPEFEDRPYLLREPTILAVRSTPAEVAPDQVLALDALLATPSGTSPEPLSWAYCVEPRRVEERTSVTAACLAGERLQPIQVPSAVPMLSDACFKFGPVSPPAEGDEQPRRPSDPDPSGGFYVPVRTASGTAAVSFGFVRVRCDLAGATREIFDAFQQRYKNNVNPAVAELLLGGRAEPEVSVASGATVALSLAPTAVASEPYVVYSAFDSALVDRAEALTIAWYVTDGTLSRAKQTLSGEELAAGARFDATWVAPSSVTTVYGWAILRDDRGGVDWRSFVLSVL